MAYQDRWVRGATQATGDRSCEARYELIRSVVDEYRRTITLWDLGANLGYFGCRLAEECGAVSIMVEQRPALAEVCRENAIPTTVAMTHSLSAEDLKELACSEHADVVLALNVLHHMDDWPEALTAIKWLGHDVLIETPGRGDTGSAHYSRSQAILDTIETMGGSVVGWSDSHVTAGVRRPMYRITNKKMTLLSGYAYRGRVRARGPHPPRMHEIASTLDTKTVRFSDGEERPWHPGVNLWNWLQMGGSYPDRATVRRLVQKAADGLQSSHGDFKPWNLILQGQSLQVIDHGHRMSVNDAKGLGQTLAWIDRPELAYAR
jgi:hypothetical protein